MLTHDGTTWLWSASLPRWYRSGGIHAAASTLYGTRHEPDRLVRWKPTIPYICGPLMGQSTKRDDGSYHVSSPSLSRRLAFYEEGLNLVAFFGERDDIFTLAVYRRQVHPTLAVSLDTRFLELADTFSLTHQEWGMLAERMPTQSRVWEYCQKRSKPSVTLVAQAA